MVLDSRRQTDKFPKRQLGLRQARCVLMLEISLVQLAGYAKAALLGALMLLEIAEALPSFGHLWPRRELKQWQPYRKRDVLLHGQKRLKLLVKAQLLCGQLELPLLAEYLEVHCGQILLWLFQNLLQRQ